MAISEHIEKHLGKIEYGWKVRDETNGPQVVRVSNIPKKGVMAYSTLGMSWTILSLPSDRTVRQELIFAAYERYEPAKIASFLLTFCQYIVSHGRALLRGEVVGPEKSLIPGVIADSLYCSLPIMFDSELATFSGSEPPTVFVWLVPILGSEANFVKLNGWNRFENILERNSPDFWDLNRPSLVET
jgi:Suppressor of fused protein (SUFU)